MRSRVAPRSHTTGGPSGGSSGGGVSQAARAPRATPRSRFTANTMRAPPRRRKTRAAPLRSPGVGREEDIRPHATLFAGRLFVFTHEALVDDDLRARPALFAQKRESESTASFVRPTASVHTRGAFRAEGVCLRTLLSRWTYDAAPRRPRPLPHVCPVPCLRTIHCYRARYFA